MTRSSGSVFQFWDNKFSGAAIAPPTSLLEEDRFSPERESAEVIEGTDSPPTFQAPGITGASFGMA